jgi:ribose-phosphate pyrophosphokinase
LLKKEGANKVLGVVTHGVFSKNSKQILEKAALDKIIITNSIPLKDDVKDLKNLEKITIGKKIFSE